MKKILNISLVYFIFAMLGGVIYREVTKYTAFTGKTSLAYVHTHLLVLGVFFFLLLALFNRDMDLERQKHFKIFLRLYNTALPGMVIMMFIRGIIQVYGISLGNAADAAVSGIAGITHILLLASFLLFFSILKRAACKNEKV